MAEVHFFGQILGGTGFEDKGLLCKVFPLSNTAYEASSHPAYRQATRLKTWKYHVQWGVEIADNTWELLEGHDRGQTHTAWAQDAQRTVWGHPIDVHLACSVRSGSSFTAWARRCMRHGTSMARPPLGLVPLAQVRSSCRDSLAGPNCTCRSGLWTRMAALTSVATVLPTCPRVQARTTLSAQLGFLKAPHVRPVQSLTAFLPE